MNGIGAIRAVASIGWFLTASAAPAGASRYCDLCDGMPWWAEPLLVVSGLLIAIAILVGLVRLDAWLARRRRTRNRRADASGDDAHPPRN
jgi:hypothetical protein